MSKSPVVELMKKDGWKFITKLFLGEVWGKGKSRVVYCPKKKKILKQYTSRVEA